jgi:hypothetical protein
VSWTDDSPIPVRHEDIVAVLEAIRTRSVADALLSFFELLEQAEVAWDCEKETQNDEPDTGGTVCMVMCEPLAIVCSSQVSGLRCRWWSVGRPVCCCTRPDLATLTHFASHSGPDSAPDRGVPFGLAISLFDPLTRETALNITVSSPR